MPIVSQSVLDRKTLFPTVYETFGAHPDIRIFRCKTKSTTKICPPGRFSCYSQCAAEFCYEDEPCMLKTPEELSHYRENIPFKNTINLEFVRNIFEIHTDASRACDNDTVRCKFCLEIVAQVRNHKLLFGYVDIFSQRCDDSRILYDSIVDLEDFHNNFLRDEQNRAANIPYNIKKFKLARGIVDVCTRRPIDTSHRPKLVAVRRKV